MSAQKASLPEDIEIMKVLHKGILEKEEELRNEREAILELRKELVGK